MSEKKRMLQVKLLEDAPASEDSFGPHKRIACAIAELITSEEPGGKAIGLEGGWGTGKSTVVKFIREELKNNKNFSVINFDAWAHQGDPLRRSYLETVISELMGASWIDAVKWTKKYKELSNRRRKTVTETSTLPTTFGIVFAISLLLVPIGAALLSASGLDFSERLTWLGVLLTASPIFIALFPLARHPRSISLKHWNFLQSRTSDKVITDSIETPDPTSIEFGTYFNEAVGEALRSDVKRKVLLILDNIDRLEAEHATSIWSTLQTFLQDRHDRENDWFSRVWFLIPYDAAGLKRSFHTAVEGSIGSHLSISDSFIDKSLLLRFLVPAPVLSNWLSYLKELVEKALPDCPESDREKIYGVYRQFRHEATQYSPTPRELKLFVNQIGTILRQWSPDEFPLNHIAYFVLFSRGEETVQKQLEKKSERLLSATAIRILGDDLIPNLAGLAYNVEASKGMEILLLDRIHRSLIEESPKDPIAELAKRYKDGFWPVLERFIAYNIHHVDVSFVARIGVRLHESGVLKDSATPEANTIISQLGERAGETAQWQLANQEIAEGISAICRFLNKQEFSSKIGIAVKKGLEATPKLDKESGDSTSAIFTRATLTIFKTFESLGHSESLPVTVSLPVDAEGWLNASAVLLEPENLSYARHFRPREDAPTLLEVMNATINDGDFGEPHLRSLSITSLCVPDYKWEALLKSIETKLDAGVGLNPEVSLWLFMALRELKKLGKPVEVAYKTLAKGGHLLYHIHRATKAKNQDCLAQCLLLQLELDIPLPPQGGLTPETQAGLNSFNQSIAASNPELANHMVEILAAEGNTSKLVDIWNRREKLEPLILDCLRVVAKGSNPESVFSSEVILDRWADLDEKLSLDENDETFDLLIAKLADSHDLCESIQNSEIGFTISDVPLYWKLISQIKSRHPSFLAWCKGELEKMDSDEWRRDLDEAQDMLWTALLLKDNGVAPSFTTHLSDALKSYAKKLAVDAKLPDEVIVKRWVEVLDLLRPEVFKALQQSILEIALESKGAASANFFALFGPLLINTELLVRSGYATTKLFSPILEENNEAGLKWLNELTKANPDILGQMPSDDNPEYIHTRILDILNQLGAEEKNPLIQSIAENIGIAAQPLDSRVRSNGA